MENIYNYSDNELHLIRFFDMEHSIDNPHVPPPLMYTHMAVAAVAKMRLEGPEIEAVSRALNQMSDLGRGTPEFEELISVDQMPTKAEMNELGRF